MAAACMALGAAAQAESRCGVETASRLYIEPLSGSERLFVTRVRDGFVQVSYGRPSYVTTLGAVDRGALVGFGAREDHGEVAVRLVAPKTCRPGKGGRRLKCKAFGAPAAGLVSVEARRPSGRPVSRAVYQRGALLAYADAGVSWRWVVARDVPVRAPSLARCYLPVMQS